MRSVQVLVIGGGASGMMAAIMARRQGAEVLLLEKNNRLGKKILATGNGKCNFTNKIQSPECYHSSRKGFPWSVIQKFGWEDSVSWFREIGILPKDRDGYLYPLSGQAVAVLHALERELWRLKTEVHIEEGVIDIWCRGKDTSEGFVVTTERGKYIAGKVVVSTGGMASPVHGSTGDGYSFVKKLGHHLTAPVPALTSLVLEGNFMKAWSGVRIQGMVSLYSGGGDITSFFPKENLLGTARGEIQMVSYGISGIPVFQISRFAARELHKGRSVALCLDSMPDYEEGWIVTELLRRQGRDGRQSMGDLLEGMLPDKLAGVLLKCSGIKISDHAENISVKRIKKLAEMIKRMWLSVKAVSDFEKAQVTSGGVCVDEVNPDTMESLCCQGLYLTGELLDVDGICGGYNLQWAWATGYLAGVGCSKVCVQASERKEGHYDTD